MTKLSRSRRDSYVANRRLVNEIAKNLRVNPKTLRKKNEAVDKLLIERSHYIHQVEKADKEYRTNPTKKNKEKLNRELDNLDERLQGVNSLTGGSTRVGLDTEGEYEILDY